MCCTFASRAVQTLRRVTDAVHVNLDRLSERLRRVWRGHRSSVANDAAYATAVAAVIGGLLGLVTLRDVVAAVLAAAVSTFANGERGHRSAVSRFRLSGER